MDDDITAEQLKQLIDGMEKVRSSFAVGMRGVDTLLISMEDIRLALPTDEARAAREQAASLIGRAMR